jgi:mono/diheme cytochrome c family protein
MSRRALVAWQMLVAGAVVVAASACVGNAPPASAPTAPAAAPTSPIVATSGPTTAPTVAPSVAPASPAAATAAPATAPATASPTVPGVPTPVSAAASPSPATAAAPTPAKAEEAREGTPSSGEEAAEGPPKPNPLPPVPAGGNPDYAPVAGADLTTAGAAAAIHGSTAAGQAVYAQKCLACHGAEGKGGIPNPGSDDGTVPPLNPLDPGFLASAKGDPATFAREIDLFIQHGSRPAGTGPVFSMIPWGDQQKLTQQQIADVEAYVMQLNGVTWPR